MIRRAWVLLCLAGVMAPAAARAVAIRTEVVHYKSGKETVSGYLALPSTPGRYPGLVVIHEWWGLVPWVKEQARNFAAQGYVALAVDLYRGKTTTNPDVAFGLMEKLDPARARRDLLAAYNYLASRPDVNKAKIGSVGWCMGGGYSLVLAEHEPKLAACVVNYGHLPTDPIEIYRINAPVLGNFGGKDQNITPTDVRIFKEAMKSAGKSLNAKIYPDAGHAFENPNNKKGYRPADAADAWNRMITFLNKELK